MADVMIPPSPSAKKRKIRTKNILNTKKLKITVPEITTVNVPMSPAKSPKAKSPQKGKVENNVDVGIKYPILKNELLIQRFLKVPMTNNQKGRIRQVIKDSLQGSTNAVVPDIIHGKIQSIIKSTPNLTDSQLRRIRILYNFLKTALNGEKIVEDIPKLTVDKEKKKKTKVENAGDTAEKDKDCEKANKIKKDELAQKVRGPKRYVVFLGNLPLDIDKEKILAHFSEMNEHIKNIRIPKQKEGKKSAIAYIELSNEASYEFALSKHHSMLGRKRINVLYTAQKRGRVSEADAKSKSAKLIALQKSGKLVGSTPLVKKRSQRRLKQKKAIALSNANA